MKKIFSFFIILFTSVAGFSQSSSFSTLGQVFNYAVGDSFEYSYSQSGEYFMGGGGTYTGGGNALLIITSVLTNGDTVFNKYTYVSQAITSEGICEPQFGYGGQPGESPFPPAPGELKHRGVWNSASQFVVYSPDSLITYLWTCSYHDYAQCLDSAFSNDSYNYHKQNQFLNNGLSNLNATFADSLGMVAMGWFDEANYQWYSQQLIWYHKANGEQWGTPVTIIPTGINEPGENDVTAKLFPNPSSGEFKVQLSETPAEESYFELFDACGRCVYLQKIANTLTEIHLSDISNGLYLWCLMNKNEPVGHGKLILE